MSDRLPGETLGAWAVRCSEEKAAEKAARAEQEIQTIKAVTATKDESLLATEVEDVLSRLTAIVEDVASRGHRAVTIITLYTESYHNTLGDMSETKFETGDFNSPHLCRLWEETNRAGLKLNYREDLGGDFYGRSHVISLSW